MINATNTPLTDAQKMHREKYPHDGDPEWYVPADFARQLETQLTQSREREERLRKVLRFYADPQSYGLHGGSSQRVMIDAGTAARAALTPAPTFPPAATDTTGEKAK